MARISGGRRDGKERRQMLFRINVDTAATIAETAALLGVSNSELLERMVQHLRRDPTTGHPDWAAASGLPRQRAEGQQERLIA